MAGNNDIEFGSDSFLDVMANMVGILIILVMIALMRAKEVTYEPVVHREKATANLKQAAAEAQMLDAEVRRLARDAEQVGSLAAGRFMERDSVALAVAARKRDLDERRKKLDEKAREQFDLKRKLAAAESSLARSRDDIASAKLTKASSVKIENYPTAISHTVYGQEVHFQLRRNRIAFVPMEELVKLFEADAQRQVHRLRDQSEVVESLGPIAGFRMRYTLERLDVPVRNGHGGAVITKVTGGFILTPVSNELGEPLERALDAHSELRMTLREYNPRQTTVTLWTYPDSFAAFRAMKKELYLLGFSVAGRPLPEGTPIGASSAGSKSAAE